ncbi:MAG: hypothetical protein AAGF20_14165 [Pseudomonadota bacterium]
MKTTLKASRDRFVTLFDATYNKQDCRDYYRMLRSLGYSNHAHAVPVFCAILDGLIRTRGLTQINVLDFASSYGIVSALIRFDISAQAFLDYYQSPDLTDLTSDEMADRDRAWLASLSPRFPQITFTALDVANNAAAYGQNVGIFDYAFAEDLEGNEPSKSMAGRLAMTDMIVECGSVAHLMPGALDRLLTASASRKPWVVTSPVRGNERQAAFEVLRDHGYDVQKLGMPPFPHRRFDDPVEQARAIAIAEAAGHDTKGLENTGSFFAQIYLARPASEAKDDFRPSSDVMSIA